MNRQEGYYFVKHDTDTQWKMASYYDGKWCIHDGARDEYGHCFEDKDFTEINESRIPSQEEIIRIDVDNERNQVTITYQRDK